MVQHNFIYNLLMKHIILALLLITFSLSQPTTGGLTRIRDDETQPTEPIEPPPPGDDSSGPSDNLDMDKSSSEPVNAAKASTSPIDTILPIYPKCDTCNKMCAAIKIYGTNLYLTKFSSWYRFVSSTNPSSAQIFNIGQNSDCTWSISNGGSYLSTRLGPTWVRPWSTSLAAHERWYIQRSGPFVYVRSVAYPSYYWRASAASYFLAYNNAGFTRLTFESFPCNTFVIWNGNPNA